MRDDDPSGSPDGPPLGRAGTPEYGSDTRGYPDAEDTGDPGDAEPDDPGDLAEPDDPGEPGDPAEAATGFWTGLGFETWADYMAYLWRMQDLYEPGRSRPRPPAPRAPGDEVADIEPSVYIAPELRSRQVNVKLRPQEGAELDRAAKAYGVAPTTLARLLVNRGVRAIVDDL